MEANKINRRKFVKLTGLTGAMLAVGFDSFGLNKPSTLRKLMAEDFVDGIPLNPFVIIAEDGTITIMATVPELGQGTFQAIPAIIAEELEVGMDQVTIVKSSASRTYGRQGIGGSRSVRSLYTPMRKLGAATRDVLIEAAANKWKISKSNCYAKGGMVYSKTNNQSIAYKDLVKEASNLQVPKNPNLKAKKDFEIIGKATKRTDIIAQS